MLSRLQEIAALKDGWLDGQGQSFCPQGLAWLGQAWQANASDLREPWLYPTPAGLLSMEWSLPPEDLVLELCLQNRRAQGTWQEKDLLLDLTDPSGWAALRAILHSSL